MQACVNATQEIYICQLHYRTVSETNFSFPQAQVFVALTFFVNQRVRVMSEKNP